MKNRIYSAGVLIGLMLCSTLGSMAFSPTYSTTKTELSISAKISKTVHSFSFDSSFLKPDDGWRSPEPEKYIKPLDEGKYDNRPINGILQEEYRQKKKRTSNI